MNKCTLLAYYVYIITETENAYIIEPFYVYYNTLSIDYIIDLNQVDNHPYLFNYTI